MGRKDIRQPQVNKCASHRRSPPERLWPSLSELEQAQEGPQYPALAEIWMADIQGLVRKSWDFLLATMTLPSLKSIFLGK